VSPTGLPVFDLDDMPKEAKAKKATARKKKAVSLDEETDEVLLTAEGLQQIQNELEHLRTLRKEALERVRTAMQFGEPMENSELEEAKSEQAVLDNRIADLQRLVHSARVVEESAHDGRVHVGTKVCVKDEESGDEFEFLIVGAVEADPARMRISNQSPVGQALLGRKKGEKVTVSTPTGNNQFIILSVE
jgi:transcription elongation factor GreA